MKQITLHTGVQACGWWTLNRAKIEASPADHWVFILYGFVSASIEYIVITPQELLDRLSDLHGHRPRYDFYLWTTKSNRCWETRGLRKSEHTAIASGAFMDQRRDFSKFLGDWAFLDALS